ncbi:alpha/beta hydrolase [Myroides sp. WP-1]|uniref:alpha/beta hydrolase n=1 Tax=Myroides sp. WP-1 TaxID=2759944 RepID=UPI0015F876E3|nr:alpha/beta hydrolase [Myroides sp. WP-1]MBB1138155.1 alpha/beta hydrolase [Myroides sp. WP-1]
MSQQKVNFKNSYNTNITMSAIINFPEGFSKNQKYPAIVVGHPAGGVKEQTAGIYAKKMSLKGFVTLAFDASYQGDSEGTPRCQENPNFRVADVRAAVDYLTTLPYIDDNKIVGIGICASGGYFVAATKQDHRIKALATVSGVDIGEMYHKGWNGQGGTVNLLETLTSANNQRTAEANGATPVYLNWVGERNEAWGKEATDGYDYYRTPRAQHPNATGEYLLTDLPALIAFHAFDRIDTLLTQPLLVVVGSNALSKWNSDFLYENAASKTKELFIVDGANHFDLYDISVYVDQAIDKISSFFETVLKNN